MTTSSSLAVSLEMLPDTAPEKMKEALARAHVLSWMRRTAAGDLTRLYVEGMTLDQARSAVGRDPRHMRISVLARIANTGPTLVLCKPQNLELSS
jgi:hypothetical protein